LIHIKISTKASYPALWRNGGSAAACYGTNRFLLSESIKSISWNEHQFHSPGIVLNNLFKKSQGWAVDIDITVTK